MLSETQSFGTVLARRLLLWARRVDLGRKLTIALALAAVVSGIATYLVITGTQPTGPNTRVRVLLLTDLALLLMLIAVVSRRLVKLWVERRRGAAGAKLHTRIVALFSMIAVTPTIIVGVFSVLFFNLGLQVWFNQPVSTAVRESVAVAEAYMEEHRKTIRADVLAMAADLNRDAAALSRSPTLFNRVVDAQSQLRSLSEAMVFERNGTVIARSSLSLVMEFEKVPQWAMDKAANGEVVILTSDYEDRVRALVRLDNFIGAYLYVGRFIEPRVLDHVMRTRQAVQQYTKLESQRSGVEITFALIFSVISLLVLLAAVSFGLAVATRLVRPISGMVAAAERVRQGDLSARVDDSDDDDEMGTLARAFNRMTMQLEGQRSELVEANRQLDERRRFTEAVLAGVSAGVIGVSRDGRIDLPNPSALRLLGAGAEQLIGQPFRSAVPEMAALFEEARSRPDRPMQTQVNVIRAGRARNLLVSVVAERSGSEIKGYVVTFDDITELVSAQRTAAWADVARRIAHEIKNPLTPIQLSAERLKRKYLKEVTSDPEIFSKCTDTIIRQVGDIGRMVDEFSSFARLPAPVFRHENLSELVRQALFLQHVAHAETDYVASLPEEPVMLDCDARQISQVLTNLLKNAAEGIEARKAIEPAAPAGRIEVRVAATVEEVQLEVVDNGKGLPVEGRAQLTEPYMTTRTKGTGLGLAIVKKIMEEHGGDLVLDDAEGGGACIRLVFRNIGRSASEAPPETEIAATATEEAAGVTKGRVIHGA